MNEFLMLIRIIIIGIAIAFAFGCFVLKGTSYYKSRFGVSKGPSVITICLSVDLFMVATMLYRNGGNENVIPVFNIIATVLIAYGIYRDSKTTKRLLLGRLDFSF